MRLTGIDRNEMLQKKKKGGVLHQERAKYNYSKLLNGTEPRDDIYVGSSIDAGLEILKYGRRDPSR
jgi:hypothetical protein